MPVHEEAEPTFQDVDTLLVGGVGVGVVGRGEHPPVDVADPWPASVLRRALTPVVHRVLWGGGGCWVEREGVGWGMVDGWILGGGCWVRV